MTFFKKSQTKETPTESHDSSININRDFKQTSSPATEQGNVREQEIYSAINHPENTLPTGDKSADLMFLIGKAINEWAIMYGLSNLDFDEFSV